MSIAFAIFISLLVIAGHWFRDIDYMPKKDRRLVIMARILLFVALFLYDMLVRGD
jgi:Mg2+ and Co2+ transporter CorA